VTRWAEISLVVMAVASLATAIVQVAVLVAAGMMARRVSRLIETVERELQPTFASVNAIGRDAARAVAAATAQVERADRLFADLAKRVDETMTTVQATIVAPAR